MDILVINGSPRGEKSNTMKVTRAFCEGMQDARDCAISVVDLSKIRIESCKGCYSCWSKTPGRCVLCDDESELVTRMLAADVVIYSFPLFYYSVPSKLKAMIERQLPFIYPFMKGQSEYFVNGGHPSRFKQTFRTVLISTCGFYPTEKSYDAVRLQFDMILGEGGYEEVFIGEGELFAKKIAERRTSARLEAVRRAGKEFAELGSIQSATAEELRSHIYPPEMYAAMADEGWGITMKDFRPIDDEIITRLSQEYKKHIKTIY